MKHKITYAVSYTLWYLLSLLPFWLLYALSDAFCFLMARVVKYRHKVIWKNISESFPDKDEAWIRRTEMAFYHWFCDYFVETVKLMTMSPAQLKRRMTFSGTETMSQILTGGQSCSVFLGHYGNWEWITSLPYWVPEGVQCLELYHPLENEAMDHLFRYVRERQNALCIPVAESLRKLVAYSRDSKAIVVGWIADQRPFWNNIHHWLPFLHHDTPVFTGAERIIKHMNHACFYAHVTRKSRGHYNCEFQLMTREPKTVAGYGLTDDYFRRLEQDITSDPAIYLWSHKRWKRTHEEFNIRYDEKTGRVDLRPLDVIKREKGLI